MFNAVYVKGVATGASKLHISIQLSVDIAEQSKPF
jgi:hypothetical protein